MADLKKHSKLITPRIKKAVDDEAIDNLEKKLDEHKEWCVFVVTACGQQGFGSLVFPSEKECQQYIDANIWTSGEKRGAGNWAHMYSEPREKGRILMYTCTLKELRMPWPI